jgi:hypothetical protein
MSAGWHAACEESKDTVYLMLATGLQINMAIDDYTSQWMSFAATELSLGIQM